MGHRFLFLLTLKKKKKQPFPAFILAATGTRDGRVGKLNLTASLTYCYFNLLRNESQWKRVVQPEWDVQLPRGVR